MSTPIKIIPPSDSDDSKKVGAPREDSTKPKTTAPNTDDGSRKPFKEVLEATMADKRPVPKPVRVTQVKDDDDDETVSLLDLAAKASVREGSQKPSITQTAVFRQDTDTDVVAEIDVDEPKDKPAIVIKDIPEEKPHAAAKQVVVEREKVVERELPTPSAKSVEKEKDDKPVTRSSDDISPKIAFHEVKNPQVDPKNVIGLATPQIAQPPPATVQTPQDISNARQAMMQLAQAMVEKIQLIKAPGRTDTTLQLKYPPLFEGVKIHISEYETSRKQLNITFSDLTNPTARALIEQTDNQAQLRQQLIDRGYTLQTITIEQKIPGLSSTETGDVALRQQPQSDNQSGSATDQEESRG